MNLPSQALRATGVLIDASGFLASVGPHDAHHDEAQEIWKRIIDARYSTFTTNFLVAETHALFLSRLGQARATDFLRQISQSNITIIRVDVRDEERAREIIFRYNDKDFSLTDAISFAVMERLSIQYAFTFDKHFTQYGLTVVTPDL